MTDPARRIPFYGDVKDRTKLEPAMTWRSVAGVGDERSGCAHAATSPDDRPVVRPRSPRRRDVRMGNRQPRTRLPLPNDLTAV